MSNLLQVIRFRSQKAAKEGNLLLMADVSVNPDSAPFLVSSAEGGLQWLEKAHPGDIVKAAVQEITTPGKIFQDILSSVQERGVREKWGNTHPFTEKGVQDAVRYLEYYGLTEVELLIPRQRGEDSPDGVYTCPDWLNRKNLGHLVHPSSWIPDDCVVVVPIDKEFVGVLAHITVKQVVVVVHNPSRGVAIARGAA